MKEKVEKILEYFNAEHDDGETTFWIKDGYMCCNEAGLDESRVKMIRVDIAPDGDTESNNISFMTDDADWTYPYDKGLKFIEECSIYKIEKIIP